MSGKTGKPGGLFGSKKNMRALMVVLLFLLLVPEKGEQAVNIRFTRGGMEVRARGDLRYFPAQAVQRRRDGRDLVLAVPGEEFVIPWTAIENNAVLLELMGLR